MRVKGEFAAVGRVLGCGVQSSGFQSQVLRRLFHYSCGAFTLGSFVILLQPEELLNYSVPVVSQYAPRPILAVCSLSLRCSARLKEQGFIRSEVTLQGLRLQG